MKNSIRTLAMISALTAKYQECDRFIKRNDRLTPAEYYQTMTKKQKRKAKRK